MMRLATHGSGVLALVSAAVMLGGCTGVVDSLLSAAHDDGFTVRTTDSQGCGTAELVDHDVGGAANGDDHIVIRDLCGDGHGVEAYVWLDGNYGGSMYDGNGVAGGPVIWAPFSDVAAGQEVTLKVCLVDGDSDATPAHCGSTTKPSVDG